MAAFNVLLDANVQTEILEESLDRTGVTFIAHQTGYTVAGAPVANVVVSDQRDAVLAASVPPVIGMGLVLNLETGPVYIRGKAARRRWLAITASAAMVLSVLEEFEGPEAQPTDAKPPESGEVT